MGSYKSTGDKEPSEVKYHLGLQVNIPITSNKTSKEETVPEQKNQENLPGPESLEPMQKDSKKED